MSNTNTSKENIESILQVLGIKKIVYVDDDVSEVTVEEVISSEKRKDVLKKYFLKLAELDVDIGNSKLREQWGDISYDIKSAIRQMLLPDMAEIDRKAIPAFKGLIPSGLLDVMSPDLWVLKKKELLKEIKTTLFLFDQDLKVSGRGDDGIRLVKEIAESGTAMTGLFTQKTSQDECIQYRNQMSIDYEIDKDKFFVIPKEEAIANQELIVYLLKLTVLSSKFAVFKAAIKRILKKAGKKAGDIIGDITVEDFEHIVFKVPLNEGAWEPDMIYRIYSEFKRKAFVDLASSDKKLQGAISKIRSVSSISTDSLAFLEPPKTREIQHNELYDEADYLNENHLPIELGDIFENTNPGSTKKYILLSQPCDLMIRSDGKRGRNSNRFALLEMRAEQKDGKKKSDKNKLYEQELWCYSPVKDEKWMVNFKDVYWIKDCVLDLCVYNDDGVSRYCLKRDSKQMRIRPSLIYRYDRIKKNIEEEISRRNRIFSEIKGMDAKNLNAVKNSIYEAVFRDELFKAKCTGRAEEDFTVTFNCKRVGRLLYERAFGLLAQFYSMMQRPAYPPDYGKNK